ncbi:RinA family protein [Lactococcus lactis]|nr:RinA family protein [Lactococcus lactis]
MVDPLDELMSDYITGMLGVKINYIKKRIHL